VPHLHAYRRSVFGEFLATYGQTLCEQICALDPLCSAQAGIESLLWRCTLYGGFLVYVRACMLSPALLLKLPAIT
jgi:hypothetical protein